MEAGKKILITGGAGYIGSAIANALLEEGTTVVIYDDLSSGRADKIDARATFIEGDVTDALALENVFKTHAFDAVVHCAAKKVMPEGEENPTKYFKNNVGGTIELLSCMEKFGVPKIIFSSTAAVYAPTNDNHSVVETDTIDPQSVYGRSKLMCEMLITEYARLGKIKEYAILRYFNVAGDIGLHFNEEHAQNVFTRLAVAIKNNTPFTIFGRDYTTRDGSGVRDYIHVADLARAHVLALQLPKVRDIYNLGTHTGYSVLELVNTFKEQVHQNLQMVEAQRRAGDIGFMVADASKAQNGLGWKPIYTLQDMVISTAKAFDLIE